MCNLNILKRICRLKGNKYTMDYMRFVLHTYVDGQTQPVSDSSTSSAVVTNPEHTCESVA